MQKTIDGPALAGAAMITILTGGLLLLPLGLAFFRLWSSGGRSSGKEN